MQWSYWSGIRPDALWVNLPPKLDRGDKDCVVEERVAKFLRNQRNPLWITAGSLPDSAIDTSRCVRHWAKKDEIPVADMFKVTKTARDLVGGEQMFQKDGLHWGHHFHDTAMRYGLSLLCPSPPRVFPRVQSGGGKTKSTWSKPVRSGGKTKRIRPQ